MTPIQKAVFTVVLLAAAGTGGYQAYRASLLQNQAKLEEERQNPDLEQNVGLLGKLTTITNQMEAARQENKKLLGQLEEISKLRAERDRLQKETLELSQARKLEGSPVEADLSSWLDRTKSLKQRFDEWPGKKTPELALLTEEAWLDAARQHLNTEEDFRKAMSELRYTAKGRFAEMIQKAIHQYNKSTKEQYPSEISQLKPHAGLPEDSPIWDGYEIAKPGTVRSPLPDDPDVTKSETWAIVEKGEPADKDYDRGILIYQGGWCTR